MTKIPFSLLSRAQKGKSSCDHTEPFLLGKNNLNFLSGILAWGGCFVTKIKVMWEWKYAETSAFICLFFYRVYPQQRTRMASLPQKRKSATTGPQCPEAKSNNDVPNPEFEKNECRHCLNCARILLVVALPGVILSVLVVCCWTQNVPWVGTSSSSLLSITALLNTNQMHHLATLAMAVSAIIVGFASEYLVKYWILDAIGRSAFAGLWTYAQLCFGFLVYVPLVSSSPLGIIPFVFGMWKMGCPETIATLECAIKTRSLSTCVASACGFVGIVCHHSTRCVPIPFLVVLKGIRRKQRK